jgi:hypothetical protein
MKPPQDHTDVAEEENTLKIHSENLRIKERHHDFLLLLLPPLLPPLFVHNKS